jgi:hypothetical protein
LIIYFVWLQHWRIGDKKLKMAIFFGSNIFGARATPGSIQLIYITKKNCHLPCINKQNQLRVPCSFNEKQK